MKPPPLAWPLPPLSRRGWLRALVGGVVGAPLGSVHAATSPGFPAVTPQTAAPRFPRDHGAHPDFRTEWWYVTGWLQRPDGAPLGMQVTFFRSRTRHSPENPSRFAPVQLALAHAALAVPEERRLHHAELARRTGAGQARFSVADTDVAVGGWRFVREADDRYRTVVASPALELSLRFTPQGPPVLQGRDGYSRKGPRPEQASLYYSRPQLAVDGEVRAGRLRTTVTGRAWLDHEWSSEVLDRDAAGWDWIGLNLDDGSALMAFRIRRRDGGLAWSHARRIDAAGRPVLPDPPVSFVPLRQWRSARSGTSWPVAMRVEVGERALELEPLVDDQELDARASTGTIYWEGAVRAFEGAGPARREVGRGYLELTGYWQPIRL